MRRGCLLILYCDGVWFVLLVLLYTMEYTAYSSSPLCDGVCCILLFSSLQWSTQYTPCPHHSNEVRGVLLLSLTSWWSTQPLLLLYLTMEYKRYSTYSPCDWVQRRGRFHRVLHCKEENDKYIVYSIARRRGGGKIRCLPHRKIEDEE